MSEDRKRQGHDATEPEPESTREEGGFLSRWSRRKREAASVREPAKNVGARADNTKNVMAPAQDPVEPANEMTDTDMPPIESLDENSDYSPFLSPKVSQKLRRVALRKLFHTAGFNIRDGLDDYDDDFTLFEPLGNTITADMRYHMEREKEKERQRLAELGTDGPTDESAEALTEPADDQEPTKLASADDDATEGESGVDDESDDGDDAGDSGRASETKT